MEDEAKVEDKESADLAASDAGGAEPSGSADETTAAPPEAEEAEAPGDTCPAEPRPERRGFWAWLKSLCLTGQSNSDASL